MKTRHQRQAEIRNSKYETWFIPVIAILLAPAALHAQAEAGDAAIIEVLMKNHSELMPMLQKQLEEAERQASKLEQQLERMGDPGAVNPESIAMIKDDVKRSASVLMTKQEKREMYDSLTGAEVFDDDANGMLEAIGAKVTLEDGSEQDRDAEKYKLEAALMAEIKQYKEVREQAIEQQKMLSDELVTVMEELEAAKDFATVQKLNATISIINGKIDDWNQKVIMARADVDMVRQEYESTARVVAKGKREETEMQSKADRDASAASKATFPGFGIAPKKLPWGRKGSDGNPGTGSVAP
ncbi:MAG TPA: hypothetical protein PK490_20000 [Prosthecobacter sp.]|nr:hypothetical protein [Prosthecobacter sp.]